MSFHIMGNLKFTSVLLAVLLQSVCPAMSKSALMILAQGAEEMETVITVDMLRRGGVTVTLAGLDGAGPVLCSRQVTLVPDKSLADALADKAQYDAVILPGGLEGSDRLSKSTVVGSVLKDHEKSGKIVAERPRGEGPGTAYWFGLTLVEMLAGKEKAAQVEKGMLITGY